MIRRFTLVILLTTALLTAFNLHAQQTVFSTYMVKPWQLWWIKQWKLETTP